MATLGVSIPRLPYKDGMNENPSTYGSSQIAASSSKSTIQCGYLTKDSVIRVLQTATSASQPAGRILEAKYSNGLMIRTTGANGTFVVTYNGGHQQNTITPGAPPATGAFTIIFNGQETSSIPYTASAADIQAALVALSNIGASDVVVTGTLASTVVIKFVGYLTLQDVPPITIGANTTGTSLTVTDTTTNATNAIPFDWFVTSY